MLVGHDYLERGRRPEILRLDLGASSYLDRSMSPAEDRVTSLTAAGSASPGQEGVAQFATTHWSLVLTAQERSPAADRPREASAEGA